MSGRATILMYHALQAARSPISLSPVVFTRQLRAIEERGMRVLPLLEVASCVRERRPLPNRGVVLTFDDGFSDFRTVALPLLADRGYASTVFLVADFCGRANDWPGQPRSIPVFPLLGWSEIEEMARAGVELGAHTRGHPRLDLLPPGDAEREVLESQDAIEQRIGRPVRSFAYPYGRSTAALREVVANHFAAGCSTATGLVSPHSDPAALERVEALYLEPALALRMLGTPALSVYLRARAEARRLAGRVLGRAWS